MGKSKKPEDFDFVKDAYFNDLTRNQKLAILNFFSVIAASNAKIKISEIESAFISQYYKEFGMTGDQYLAYISVGGRERTIEDIKSLNKENMQDLVYATTELFNCDGELNENEFSVLINWLDDIGMSIEAWNDMLEHNGE